MNIRHSKAVVSKLPYGAQHEGCGEKLDACFPHRNTTTAMYEIEQCDVQIKRSMWLG
jgi:hypothetical protein